LQITVVWMIRFYAYYAVAQEQLGLRGFFGVTLLQLPPQVFNGCGGVVVPIRVYSETVVV
jgi:hypothetical protein